MAAVRYIFLFLLGLLGIWWLRRKFDAGAARPRKDNPAAQPPAEPERITACAQCGLHVPESEGVMDGEHFYCSDAHRRLGPRA